MIQSYIPQRPKCKSIYEPLSFSFSFSWDMIWRLSCTQAFVESKRVVQKQQQFWKVALCCCKQILVDKIKTLMATISNVVTHQLRVRLTYMRKNSFTKHVLSQANTNFKDLKVSNPIALIREISLNVMCKCGPHYALEVESLKERAFLFLAPFFHSSLLQIVMNSPLS